MDRVVFTVYPYWRKGEEPPPESRELAGYCQRYGLVPGEDELLLSGRLCAPVRLGDTLLTESGYRVMVQELSAYGRRFDALEAGMTCLLRIRMEGEGTLFLPGNAGKPQKNPTYLLTKGGEKGKM